MSGATARAAPRTWASSSSIALPALAITAITVLAAALRVYDLASVPGNPFYDAAVRSMGLSWHNFFFAAFEPSGRLAVDKPPIDLWLQVLSVKAFGFNSAALKLPEALAGAAAVPLLYDLVRRVFGEAAGLASALALAVLPVAVLTSRSDTMDSVMMLAIVGGAWLVVRAAQSGRARYLYLAGAVLGIAFNVKLFEALLPLPALALLYVIAAPQPARRKITHLAAAGAVLVAVSLSWVVAVSLSPAASRPYAIGSSNGSVWNSIFVFDGVHRLGSHAHGAAVTDTASATGHPSATRLLGRGAPALGLRAGSELLAALVFGALALVLAAAADRRRLREPGSATRRGLAIALAVWLLTGFVAFSVVGRLQARYLEAFTPAIAASLGIGVAWAAQNAQRRPSARAALAIGLGIASAYGVYLSSHGSRLWLVEAAVALVAMAAVLSLGDGRRRLGSPAVAGALCMAALLVVPISQSLAVVRHHATDAAGVRFPPRELAATDRYLQAHRGHARYEVATLNPYQAAPLIARAGQPVLVLFNVNRHPLVSTSSLHRLAHAGEVRYVFLGTACGGARMSHSAQARSARYRSRHQCVTTANWVRSHGRRVRLGGRYQSLYRLRQGNGP